ncbi:SDR family NAD(P)-dependent oxidoreductase [Glycomyces sp. TRM65418]|uniref:SDR family NAD(P)-dependent oxidoreductase n=1 Tax=Glycomyces sp. TRM65418 TaxID=2867006 RepID=UPI001D162FAB|nr:SDR family NAD(P)-dependent oxidoreductase [Glycomyces sp. TRM65418]MCC3762990.1 SDR family NAD(P)-dependent oxidoreductase [Glycomyces sp. TRM65418]
MSDASSQARPTALVTGAAAGIGAAFARRLAREGYRLVLVDRNGGRLRETAPSLSAECEVIAADLVVDADVARVEERCREGVELLVNCAGFGHPTGFLATPVQAEVAMSRLHTETVLRLTLAALPSMIERRRGGVINIASVLGFFPSSTYSATKAWVINFSQSAAVKTRPHRVAVTALCPGFTRTEFHDSAGMNMSKIPGFLWLDADAVARAALRDWRSGKALSVPGWQNKAIVALGRLTPSWVIARLLARSGRRPLVSRAGDPQ